ncbi:MAG: cell division protein FtsZ [Allosphingosinicella sp.]
MDSDLNSLRPRICVIGVGGSGGNAISNMIRNQVEGVEFVVANTDAQSLLSSPAEVVLQLGRRLTQGLGAGSRPEIGSAAAEEALPEIEAVLEGMNMCFIAAGMGGGTGTGAAPVIAKAARARGILTVGVVTKPFAFEGVRRARAAEAGLEELRKHVDTLIVIPNQNLFRVADSATTFRAAFELADGVLQQGVRGITDLMVMPGLINLDFADVRSIMTGMGQAMMGTGEAGGDDRAMRAAEQAISNPLLDHALKGARGLIISVIGGEDMTLMEVDEAASYIKDMVDPEADIIWGSAFNNELKGRIRVSVVATGIDPPEAGARQPERPAAADVRAIETMRSPVQWPSPAAEPELPAFLPPVEVVEAAPPFLLADLADRDDSEAHPFRVPEQEELELVAAGILPEPRSFNPLAGAPEDYDVEERRPSLFERMAALARGAARAQAAPDPAEMHEDRARAA